MQTKKGDDVRGSAGTPSVGSGDRTTKKEGDDVSGWDRKTKKVMTSEGVQEPLLLDGIVRLKR